MLPSKKMYSFRSYYVTNWVTLGVIKTAEQTFRDTQPENYHDQNFHLSGYNIHVPENSHYLKFSLYTRIHIMQGITRRNSILEETRF